MGKGDKKTKRGKILMGSHGVRRPRRKLANVIPIALKEEKPVAPIKEKAPAKHKAAKEEVVAAKEEVVAVKKEVVTVKKDVVAVKKDVVAVKKDVEAVKKEVVAVKKEVVAVKENVEVETPTINEKTPVEKPKVTAAAEVAVKPARKKAPPKGSPKKEAI